MVYVEKSRFFQKYYVVNFSWSGWASKTIKSGTQSHWSHTGIITNVEGDEITILESIKSGPKLKKYSRAELEEYYDKKLMEVINFGINPNKPNTIWEKYIESNTKYGWESIMGIFLYKFGVTSKIDVVGTVICSQLVSRLLYELSDQRIKLGFKPDSEDKTSEFNREFWRIEPKHISLSKYGDRIQLNKEP